MARLSFWFEFASTYSYLAAMRVEAACAARGVELEWKPFLLGPIFAAQGWTDSPFNLYPAKGAYMWRDMEREARRLSLPFRRPKIFPQNGLQAARIVTAHAQARWLPDFVRAVYTANFAEGRDISDVAVLQDILTGLSVDAVNAAQAAQSPQTKQALKDATEKARQIGLFGAPSFVADGEVFWGNDRLEAALNHVSNRVPPST